MTPNDPDATPWDEMIVVGRIARAHGNRGQVIVNVETDFPDRRFRPGSTLHAAADGQPQRLEIVAARFHGGRPVLTLEGVDTMDQAEALAGLELRVPESELPVLPPGSFYHHTLTGCAVRTVEGVDVGTVTAVSGSSGAHRLLVRRAGDPDGSTGEIDVPLAAPICVQVDPERRVIVVDPPKGLLELNRRR
ncbi:MAG: 16S rRNA processing protein RimM [Acidobacteria bacterium]|nr:16S rRNA processing protein RimM [Acidobacteriota bacterium]